MNDAVNFIKRNIGNFIRFLFLHIIEVIRTLNKAKDGIPSKELMHDTFSVVQKTGFFFVLNVAAFIMFAFLPQGKDIIFIVSEEVGRDHRSGNLIWLLVGVLLWSIISEFACRYSIYVSDNSGKSLSQERVQWRKHIQKVAAELALMTPFFIILLAFMINYLNDTTLKDSERNWGFGIPMVLVYLMLNGVVWIYIKRNPGRMSNDRVTEERKKEKEKEKSGQDNDNKGSDTEAMWERFVAKMQSYIFLPAKEFQWCDKLYGIYNDYVFTIRKPENFLGKEKRDLDAFCANFLSLPEAERNNFPKDENRVFEYCRAPQEFVFKNFSDDTRDKTGMDDAEKAEAQKKDMEGMYRWVYRVPNSFFGRLHRQVLFISALSLLIFFTIALLKLDWYECIGAPGIVVLAFASWTGIYVGILFLDYAVFRPYRERSYLKRVIGNFPLRLVLYLWVALASFINKDHPVHYNHVQASDTRPELREHFGNWMDKYVREYKDTLRTKSGRRCYPLVFICAEGGASRTGAYTAMLLSTLQDSFLYRKHIDFKRSVYCFSGVSGGSLGLGFFNSVAYLQNRNEIGNDTMSVLTKKFFSKDFLAPVLGKLFFGEVINLFLPWTVERFDRAIALEQIWECGYHEVLYDDSRNYFSADCRQLFHKTHVNPAMFINTTEVETGRQCWISNVRTQEPLFLDSVHDLLTYKVRGGINYSTMINFSTRFPLISPGGCLEQDHCQRLHYVDGGYYENSGAGTMIEIYRTLRPMIADYECRHGIVIVPYAISLRFGVQKGGDDGAVSFGNGITEIIGGLYNVRSGRTEYSVKELRRLIQEDNKNGFIELCLEEDNTKVPMNWVLSEKSLDNIQTDVVAKWRNRKFNGLDKLFMVTEKKPGLCHACGADMCPPDAGHKSNCADTIACSGMHKDSLPARSSR